MNGYTMSNTSTNVQFVPTAMDPPAAMDWRTKGYVTKVKNQVRASDTNIHVNTHTRARAHTHTHTQPWTPLPLWAGGPRVTLPRSRTRYVHHTCVSYA